MHEYRTDFNLTASVNDIVAAREYLSYDDMTKYLYSDFPQLSTSNLRIKWVLTHPNKGHISLVSDKEIDEEMLKKISKWVKDQNSDGIGEGFKQQDFAYVQDGSDDFEDESKDLGNEEFIICSFDWKTNDYEFREI